ncbi:MAG TPA: Hsp20/alpha crystallin family protein [Oscillatoriaceae cyanobacterium M33_DOE_052]|uniref:Hsp20/alpha crystallin family protein n=1 Tax=Planktothricoides sp. SpSt-374 TaxID=2282167 RepID=A0A7C3VVE3_9CYAN|nr:Hsp20/alpha crystallin family protein [Oscillatoriaceae cyanobacterium M33_DOE_052]
MALMRYYPLREIDTMQRQLNRLFENLYPYADGEPVGFDYVPPAELEETAEALLLRLEIPGLEAKDIDIQATADSVTVTGDRLAIQTDEKAMFKSEFRYGKFRRQISLPKRIQNTQVTAEYKNGILHLTLPKAEAEKNKVVKVQLG